jgi:dUTP pyrophosphatase
MTPTMVAVTRLPHGTDLPLPAYETAGSAGMDLRAAVDDPVRIEPMERKIIPTGLAIGLPVGFEGQVRPRSGLALKHGITVLNAPGTVDSDYRGEVGVLLINLSGEAYTVNRGDRVGQLVVAPVATAKWLETQGLDDTARGLGGFGSTGEGP